MVGKIRSFSHTELDKEEFTDREKVVRRVRNGTDMFERKGEENKFDRVDDNTDVPWFVLERKEKYRYLLVQNPPGGNVRDYKPWYKLRIGN